MRLFGAARYVMLDTATLVGLSSNRADLHFKELSSMLKAGEWVPFITWHHLEELFSHENDVECERRSDFIASLRHIAFMATGDDVSIGSSIHLRRAEMSSLCNRAGSLDEVVESVKPLIRGGFASGEQFMEKRRLWWDLFRTHIAPGSRRNLEEIANVTHFRPPGSDAPVTLQRRGRAVTVDQWRTHFSEMAVKMEAHLRERGDSRKVDPGVAPQALMNEAFSEMADLIEKGGDGFDERLKRKGVRLERLPTKFTPQDCAYEYLFIASLDVLARQSPHSKEEMIEKVRKEQMPSWIIWEQIDRGMKALAKSETGNVIDRMIASFAPYVDVFNADKRVAEVVRQAARRHNFLKTVAEKIPEASGVWGLVARLRK